MWLHDFIQLIYPQICPVCLNSLAKNENQLCTACLFSLPRTAFHGLSSNALEESFWGRLPVKHGTAFLFFEKKNRTQQILHEIKYRNNRELGIYMGRLFASELRGSSFDTVDGIVPVPLHPKKLHQRGYNQAELIANGMGDVMNKPVYNNLLVRNIYTTSQTRQGRYERWENMEEAFALNEQMRVQQKHLLLVDDVITTGATLEAAGQHIAAGDNSISVASLAYTYL
ncbi:MAG: ComF family protein [Bacteroidetes bacterium]|jgi:ComF family protein|nr:ComF family protein [Bacteroidota bacterium]